MALVTINPKEWSEEVQQEFARGFYDAWPIDIPEDTNDNPAPWGVPDSYTDTLTVDNTLTPYEQGIAYYSECAPFIIKAWEEEKEYLKEWEEENEY